MPTEINDWRDFLFWWLASLFASTMVVVARLGMKLYGEAAGDPPSDPAMEAHWERRRRWLAIGELSSLPAFATLSVVLVSYYHLDPVAGVLIAIGQGFLGFPLLLDGAAWLFRKRLGLVAPPGSAPTAGEG